MTYREMRQLFVEVNIIVCLTVTFVLYVVFPNNVIYEVTLPIENARTIPKLPLLLTIAFIIIGFSILYLKTDKQILFYISLMSYLSYVFFFAINYTFCVFPSIL